MRVYEYNPFVIFGFLNLAIFFLIKFFKENPSVEYNLQVKDKVKTKKRKNNIKNKKDLEL